MKTLKKFFTCFEILIKKIFFIGEITNLNAACGSIPVCNDKEANDIEGIKFEEYLSRYKSTTRWQTV